MKKLISFVLLLVIAFSIMGAIPTKMVKLTIINKSGYDVYMRLEGSPLTDTFHYLTIEAGDRDAPVTKLFTIMSDVYTRTTWQCNGLESTGNLVVDGNIRLTFLPCNEMQCAWSEYDPDAGWLTGCDNDKFIIPKVTHYTQGEPRMEKVTYWDAFISGIPKAGTVHDGYWNYAKCYLRMGYL